MRPTQPGLMVLVLLVAGIGALATNPVGVARAHSIGIASATFTAGDNTGGESFIHIPLNAF